MVTIAQPNFTPPSTEMFGITKGLERYDAFNKGNLPTVEDCITHLRLLETFVVLGERVREWAHGSAGEDADASWKMFVRLAVLRFQRWFCLVSNDALQASLPPLDVLMVWHSFMLSPRSYANFVKSARPDAAGNHGIPWPCVHAAISADSTTFTLSKPQTKHIALLGLASDLLESLKSRNETSANVFEIMSDDIGRLETENAHLPCLVLPPVDLAAAVHRQAAFSLKMARFGWIHSPHADSTLRKSITRYGNFFSILAVVGPTAVPALDIDLVWHTHQLSPARYVSFSVAAADGRFINHNDNVEQPTIVSSFGETERLYLRAFAEEYAVCHSWFCQAARLKPGGVLSFAERAALESGITDLDRRNQQLRLSVAPDLARCRCNVGGLTGADLEAAIEFASCSNCSSDCNGS
ncbi:hypothetical protein QBC47DRAFT_395263 [Echria macrotheca]|uniref:Uncharacterized protein n=1 Tax=Echria macrotheca TaxID=438768 RepID=A0AAJ0B3Y5_9PEZI|nr:hypothetical protein QBC47DRAFT_395263 [Echria macrotheca]